VVGTGTYGEVYKARHKRTGELTAIKVLELIEVRAAVVHPLSLLPFCPVCNSESSGPSSFFFFFFFFSFLLDTALAIEPHYSPGLVLRRMSWKKSRWRLKS
jgi:serine/threonine protein kinase